VRKLSSVSLGGRDAMSRHDAVVVEPQELDHVAHVGVVLDPPG
jgi:hypothetical protein